MPGRPGIGGPVETALPEPNGTFEAGAGKEVPVGEARLEEGVKDGLMGAPPKPLDAPGCAVEEEKEAGG